MSLLPFLQVFMRLSSIIARKLPRTRPEIRAVLIAQGRELSTASLASTAVRLYMSIHVRAVHL